MPSLITRMLERLDVRDGHRVLEIGTGAGYNAALLCHRLGDEHIYSVDIETELIDLARDRLARLGYRPTLVVTDGAHGLPEHAPYDRIIATCSVPSVPWSWVQQTRENGLILVDVKIGRLAGNLVLLQRRGPTAEGRFDPVFGSFMGIRGIGELYRHPRGAAALPTRDSARQRTTTLDLIRPWEHSVFWFFAHTALPHGTTFSLRGDGAHQPPRNTVLHSPDGSWCEVCADRDDDGTHSVWETGPYPLWRVIETAYAQWQQLGRPGWGRFGLTVTSRKQVIWLDNPEGEHTWPVPQI